MSFLRKTKQEPMMGSWFTKLHRLGNACTKCERNSNPLGGAGIRQKSGENDPYIGAKMICCRWQMRSWIYCKLSALSAIFCETIQPVTPSNNKVRNFWVAMTPYFVSQGINYRTLANPFGVAVPTVCRIVHETTKANVDNLTPDCAKFSESDAEYFDALVTFQAKHIPNGWFSSNRNSRITSGQTLLVARR